jgi:hypothetical protein
MQRPVFVVDTSLPGVQALLKVVLAVELELQRARAAAASSEQRDAS